MKKNIIIPFLIVLCALVLGSLYPLMSYLGDRSRSVESDTPYIEACITPHRDDGASPVIDLRMFARGGTDRFIFEAPKEPGVPVCTRLPFKEAGMMQFRLQRSAGRVTLQGQEVVPDEQGIVRAYLQMPSGPDIPTIRATFPEVPASE